MGTKKPGSSRREFLKSATALSGATMAAILASPFNAVVIAGEEPKGEGPWYGYGVDIEK